MAPGGRLTNECQTECPQAGYKHSYVTGDRLVVDEQTDK